MRNFEEQAQELLNSPYNLIAECEKKLEKQKIVWTKLKHDIVEWQGALIRAGLPYKKIEYKPKEQEVWRTWMNKHTNA